MYPDRQRRESVDRDQQRRGHDDTQSGQSEVGQVLQGESAENRGSAPQRGCRNRQQSRAALDSAAGSGQSEGHYVSSAQGQSEADPETIPERLAKQRPCEQGGEERLRLLQQSRRSRIAELDGFGEADRGQRGSPPADPEQRSPLLRVQRQPLRTNRPKRQSQRRRQDQVLDQHDLGARQNAGEWPP